MIFTIELDAFLPHMFPTPGLYDLTPKIGRQRIGLTRQSSQRPRPLLQSNNSLANVRRDTPTRTLAKVSDPVKHEDPEEDILPSPVDIDSSDDCLEADLPVNPSRTMPPRVASHEVEEEDIFRPPDGSDSSDDDGRANMKKIVFTNGSSQPGSQATKSTNTQKTKAKNTTINASVATSKARRSTRTEIVSTQDGGSSSPKRKSQEEPSSYGSGMVDAFGWVNSKKPKTKRSSQARYGKTTRQEDSPQKKFQKYDLGSDFEDSPKKKSISNQNLDLDSRASTPKKLIKISDLSSPAPTPDSTRKEFVMRDIDSSPLKKRDEPETLFNNPMDLSIASEVSESRPEDSLVASRKLRGRKKKQALEEPPLTQLPSFKMYDDMEELIGAARSMVDLEKDQLELIEDDFPTMIQRARCPMCNKPVDIDDLKAYGNMDTRKQEKFCQSHQKKTALEDWDAKGYPEIDWDHLDARISKHFKFIKKLINGGKSPYRDMFQQIVDTGQDRNLLKMNTNLIPGYFGGRGLRAISEIIMHEFTPLIKKRAVKDKLIAARTVVDFVQYVLVPEVTVLMIMEDMDVEVEEARDILKESAIIGELVHEEIKEVVTKRVNNSEDDDDDLDP
ncbi:hypothetical protein G7Y89_g3733 [Cudoniella acicularis]|uniref:Restriction of telomere capping protein 4 n=1 Tax=Cudoniella acicularis TaxID=354080 RepID=A0A8H4W7D1_9HELO|nr:hypothetical protein G7Y89_g3733 [Cudoniella acicularis]